MWNFRWWVMLKVKSSLESWLLYCMGKPLQSGTDLSWRPHTSSTIGQPHEKELPSKTKGINHEDGVGGSGAMVSMPLNKRLSLFMTWLCWFQCKCRVWNRSGVTRILNRICACHNGDSVKALFILSNS